ncbi:MAG: hypothetical protein P8H62_00220, partial [Henriciella sp.]|nr:hypothetical protein [Henriciella sp.]
MSNAPPQAHPNWMLTATPKGWHYNPHPIWMRLSSVSSLLTQSGFLCWVFLTALTPFGRRGGSRFRSGQGQPMNQAEGSCPKRLGWFG